MKLPFSTIVVPTDFSEHAEHALREAETLASDPDVSLHLLHIVDMPTVPMLWSSAMYVPDLPANEVAKIREAECRLDRQCAALIERGVMATFAVAVGNVARAVTEYAAEVGADLVVMSTHGRTGIARATLGSVTEQVVRTAPCAVLTIPPQPGTLSRRGAA